jgi:hypothetical protein
MCQRLFGTNLALSGRKIDSRKKLKMKDVKYSAISPRFGLFISRFKFFAVMGLFCLSFYLLISAVYAAGQAGDVVETDMVGSNLWTYNFATGAQKNIGTNFGLSEFVGLHYYFVNEVRVGMAFQFTEALNPAPAPGKDAFSTFALLPQIGWNFLKPFFIQLTVSVPLRMNAVNEVDFGLQPVLGASLSLAPDLSATLALEIPFYLALEQTVGVTPLAGIGWKL